MGNCLTAVGASVDDDAVAAGDETVITSNLHGSHEKTLKQGRVLGGHSSEVGEMALGDNQQVDWGLGIDVAKYKDDLILMYEGSGHRSGGHAAEEASGVHA
jgi:hypothetical protein